MGFEDLTIKESRPDYFPGLLRGVSFWQVPKGRLVKKRKYVKQAERVSSFLEKVDRIKKTAEEINKKL